MYAHTYAYARSSSNIGANPALPAFLLSIRYKTGRARTVTGTGHPVVRRARYAVTFLIWR